MHAPRDKDWRQRLMRSGYFVGAILFHLILFLMLASLVIWKAPTPHPDAEFRSVSIKVPPPPVQPPSPEGSAASNPNLEPDPVVVPVVTPRITISTTSSSSFSMDASKELEQARNHLEQRQAQGSGLGTGSGRGNSGAGSVYGSSEGTADVFTGYLYDMKQTPDRKPTDAAEDAFESAKGEEVSERNSIKSVPSRNNLKILRSFAKTWNMQVLDDYFKAPDPLYLSQIVIPAKPSPDATKAFHVHDVVRARRWIIIYSAKIKPPQSGRFRFIGFADDFMVVRINGQNVLDASMGGSDGEELDPAVNSNEDVGKGPGKRPLKCGSWVNMEAQISMNIDVLIGEGPGGTSCFLLMVQKEGDNSPKGDYPVFQLQNGDIPDLGGGFVFSKKKMLFQTSEK